MRERGRDGLDGYFTVWYMRGEVVKMKNNLRGGLVATESNQNYSIHYPC